MDSHNCLSCGSLISTLFFYCYECRQERARIAKEAREVTAAPLTPGAVPGDSLNYWRPF